MGEETADSSGFDAICDVMEKHFPDQEGLFYGTVVPYSLGGEDPLDGVEIWDAADGAPHWLYVSYGFSELYEKECEDPDISGYGFELTFRLKKGSEDSPPIWPVNLMQNLARYVFSSGNAFADGHHMDCNGPIALETDTALTALAFRTDPVFGEIDTPNGHVTFLQMVGITADEMEALMCWNCDSFLREMDRAFLLCITDLDRPSMMGDPSFRSVWEEGVEKDGSSTSGLYVETMSLKMENGRGTIITGAGNINILCSMLRARVGKGRSLTVYGPESTVSFIPDDEAVVAMEGDMMAVGMPSDSVEEVCRTLLPKAGSYILGCVPIDFVIQPTEILDSKGNVISTMG